MCVRPTTTEIREWPTVPTTLRVWEQSPLVMARIRRWREGNTLYQQTQIQVQGMDWQSCPNSTYHWEVDSNE